MLEYSLSMRRHQLIVDIRQSVKWVMFRLTHDMYFGTRYAEPRLHLQIDIPSWIKHWKLVKRLSVGHPSVDDPVR